MKATLCKLQNSSATWNVTKLSHSEFFKERIVSETTSWLIIK